MLFHCETEIKKIIGMKKDTAESVHKNVTLGCKL